METEDIFKKISGLNMSGLILLAARPGMGKTFFCAKYGANRGGEKDCGGVFAGDVPGAGGRSASRTCATS